MTLWPVEDDLLRNVNGELQLTDDFVTGDPRRNPWLNDGL